MIIRNIYPLYNGAPCGERIIVWPNFLGVDLDSNILIHFDEHYEESEYELVYYDIKDCFAVCKGDEPDSLIHFRWHDGFDYNGYSDIKVKKRVLYEYIFESDDFLYIMDKDGIFHCTIYDIYNNIDSSSFTTENNEPELIIEGERYKVNHDGLIMVIKEKTFNDKSENYEENNCLSGNQVFEGHKDNK